MTVLDEHRPLPAIKSEHALAAEADTGQALVDGLHHLLAHGDDQVGENGAPGG